MLNIHWKDWCWSWNSNTVATWCKEVTHWKSPWCWERLKVGEGDDRGWDGWMASPTQQTWVCVNSGNWWWTGKPGLLQYMGSQRVRHHWVTELNYSCVGSCDYCGGSRSAPFFPCKVAFYSLLFSIPSTGSLHTVGPQLIFGELSIILKIHKGVYMTAFQ